jgi:hypothetical protein
VQAAVSWHLNVQEFESVISLPGGTVGVLLVRTLMLRHNDILPHFRHAADRIRVKYIGWNVNLVDVDGRSEN